MLCAVFAFGTIIGSFLNVVILRLPQEEKLGGRSRCPHCHRMLGPLDLIPVLSFLFLGGKCRGCHKKISPRYFIIEVATGLLFVWAFMLLLPLSVLQIFILARYWLIIAVLIVVFMIDFEHYLILDSVLVVGSLGLLLLMLPVGFLSTRSFLGLGGFLLPSLLSAVLCPLPFFLIWHFSGGKWMGFGDVKLAVFLGLALGWPLWPIGLLLGIFLGGLAGILLLLFSNSTLKSRVPFGTFLSIGALAAVFYGNWILHWYISLLGF